MAGMLPAGPSLAHIEARAPRDIGALLIDLEEDDFMWAAMIAVLRQVEEG